METMHAHLDGVQYYFSQMQCSDWGVMRCSSAKDFLVWLCQSYLHASVW